MTLLFVLLSSANWIKENAYISDDSSYIEPKSEGIYMLFDVVTGEPVFLHPSLYWENWCISKRDKGSWTTTRIPVLSEAYTWAYDKNGTLARVRISSYANADSLMICYYPDVNDTIHYAKLDSMPSIYTMIYLSELRFMNGRPVFAYSNNWHYDGDPYFTQYIKLASADETDNWKVEIIDSIKEVPDAPHGGRWGPRLSVGSNNKPYILLLEAEKYYPNRSKLLLGTEDNDKWTFDYIDTLLRDRIPVKSFAVDKNGYVHVLHSHDRRVFYTTNKSGNWCTDTIYKLTGYEQMAYCWLSLTPWGLPEGIANDCDWDGTILSHYFHNDGSAWRHDTVPYVSWFDIDRWGNPHIMAIDTFYQKPPDTVFHYWLPVGVEEPAAPATPASPLLDVGDPYSIRYSLPSGEQGTISLYDPTGRRIESYKVQGEGQAAIKVSLPSGVYFIKLEAGKASVTKKAVVLR